MRKCRTEQVIWKQRKGVIHTEAEVKKGKERRMEREAREWLGSWGRMERA